MGHHYHVILRKTTRVQHNGSIVLSRNEAHAQKLAQKLGRETISHLHSHLTSKSFSAESILRQADIDQVKSFVDRFVPDAILLCVDHYVVENEPLLEVSVEPPSTTRIFHIISDESGCAVKDTRIKVKTEVNITSQQEIKRKLQDILLANFDAERSLAAIQSVVSKHQAVFDEFFLNPRQSTILRSATSPQAASKRGVATVEAVAAAISLSKTRGEIETLKDGDIVFGERLWIKGWIDFNHNEIKCLVIHINDKSYPCFPGSVRGELATRLKNFNILGFESHIPLDQEGSRLAIKVNLLSTDGREHGWKKLFAWSNNSIPKHYRTPVITGIATIEKNQDSLALKGVIKTESYKIVTLRGICRGVVIVEGGFSGEAESENFSIKIPNPTCYQLKMAVHLWVELLDKDGKSQTVYWMRCEHKDSPVLGGSIAIPNINGVAQEVSRGSAILRSATETVTITFHNRGSSLYAFVNGLPADKIVSRGSLHDISFSTAPHGNSVLLEITNEFSDVTSCQLWKHIADPESRNELTAIGIQYPPLAASLSLRNKTPHRCRSVLLIRKSAAPTDELYILAPMREMIKSGEIKISVVDIDDGPISDEESEFFLKPGTVVIVSRYINDDWLNRLTTKASSLGQIFYLMDDDVASAEDARWLPGGYRKRMMQVAHGEFQSMLNLCDRFIVTCDFLARRFSSPKTVTLEPPYLHPPGHLRHLENSSPIIIAYHGTQVHRDDVTAIAQALRNLHDKYPEVRLQIVMGEHAPAALKGLTRVEIVQAMPWSDYKRFIETSRAHIAIAPILETPYNLGKSIIKIMDIAALGAVGVYTRSEPYTKYIENGKNGFLVENDPLMWQKTLSWLIEHPAEIRRMAQNCQILAHRVGSLKIAESFWRKALDLVT